MNSVLTRRHRLWRQQCLGWMLAGLAVATYLIAAARPAYGEWVYRTVRVCEPRTKYVQKCAPVRQCDTKYRHRNVWCGTCRPPGYRYRRVPYRTCYTQTRCRRQVVNVQQCRNVQRRVWVRNPRIIPEPVLPPRNPPPKVD